MSDSETPTHQQGPEGAEVLNGSKPALMDRQVPLFKILLVVIVLAVGAKKLGLIDDSARTPAVVKATQVSTASQSAPVVTRGFRLQDVKRMSCRDDGADPQTWDEGTVFFDFLPSGQVLINMRKNGVTYSGDWSFNGQSLLMDIKGGVTPNGQVVPLKATNLKSFDGAMVKGTGADGSTLIRTQGWAFDCLTS